MWWRQPRIFISYRRDDSAVHARAVFDQLVDGFGEAHVFLDVEDIDYGDEFARIIDERIEACDVVVALIGPRWLTLAGKDGQPRIASDGDYVRREIASALRMRKQLIPVLVGGAAVPGADALPRDIAALCERNILVLDDRQIGEGIDKLLDAIRGQRASRAVTWATQRRTAHAMAVGVAVALLMAAWISLFDFFALETRTASLSLWAADVIAPQAVSDDLRLVVVTPETERALGHAFKRNPAARRDHARLVERLSQAQARTVAFDIFFTTPSDADDAVFAAAMQAARQRGTAIVLAANELRDGAPVMVPALREAVTAWAVPCIGQRLGYATTVPLASQSGTAPTRPGTVAQARAVGLALAAAHPGNARISASTGRVLVASARDGAIAEIPFSELDAVTLGQSCHVGSPGDLLASALHRLPNAQALRDPVRRVAYERVLAMESAELRSRFAGKTVLVGLQMPGEDVFPVFRATQHDVRHGIELHAAALGALLDGAVVRPVGWGAQFVLMLACALAGSRLRLWAPGGRAWPRRLSMAALIGLCIAGAIAVCATRGVLVNVPYLLAALALGHWAAGRGTWSGRPARRPLPTPSPASS